MTRLRILFILSALAALMATLFFVATLFQRDRVITFLFNVPDSPKVECGKSRGALPCSLEFWAWQSNPERFSRGCPEERVFRNPVCGMFKGETCEYPKLCDRRAGWKIMLSIGSREDGND